MAGLLLVALAAARARVLPQPRVMASFARARAPIRGMVPPAGAMPASGGDNLYRKFGITEDADYDEIVAAYERLCSKNAGDKKELIRLEVAKDRILEDRLRRRMSGALQSKVVESSWDRAQRLKKRRPFNEYLPPYVRKFFEKPDEKFAINLGIFFALVSGAALLLPAMASTGMSLAFLVANGVIYNKGLPEKQEDTGRRTELKPLLSTLGITTILGGLGFSLGVLLAGLLFPDGSLQATGLIGALTVAGLGFATLFFKVQDV
ncbi:hypothetical protein KFE25_001405 [Diacronema lutheri]|uniref:J domain-containing protein n=1 Tax=Diacronema lutheri TaxID=2081491 RepID=A0A8J5XDM9_DIALT|nr:hypothetical protein KFE25_001405 [Diacronema lutheri]